MDSGLSLREPRNDECAKGRLRHFPCFDIFSIRFAITFQ
jgi:hypothetical protein